MTYDQINLKKKITVS